MTVKSMTGYGKGVSDDGQIKVTVELKAVNHRFLDLSVKLPKMLNFAEESVRRALKDAFVRGHIEAFINVEDKREDKGEIIVDEVLAGKYADAALKLSNMLGDKVASDLGTRDLMRLPGVVEFDSSEMDESELSAVLQKALPQAIEGLDAMRVAEGENLRKDMLAKLGEMTKLVATVERLSPDTVKKHGEKVRKRVQEFLADVAIDESKFLNEMAFYADKVAVDEEVTRLNSHVARFTDIIAGGGAVGKSLDFIVQEMNREANTIGSKCCDSEVAAVVVELKCIIEKIREQIQNLE